MEMSNCGLRQFVNKCSHTKTVFTIEHIIPNYQEFRLFFPLLNGGEVWVSAVHEVTSAIKWHFFDKLHLLAIKKTLDTNKTLRIL